MGSWPLLVLLAVAAVAIAGVAAFALGLSGEQRNRITSRVRAVLR